ncbi:proline--tRNA ligase [Candidatus Atelocyanobacterium thalassae]|uniref:Proline--tRNA ligase n=1 Tax=cyanobacterium endosymbiont of Braarudosphaera bigelowii TaxID=1285375 RepID=A0ABN6JYE4_9CHRO|nr:proline--tRNA ligase [Candidatus Atelocyanobacterium thalassa]BDA39400.1 proline--tRNA ligase [cyanobacterium endosymbiont of Braarudosphaera bigelowii]
MRLSQVLFVTLREDPAEAEIMSHKLLLRACYIRRISSGIYSYLPLMWRVLQKTSQIVREEMNFVGAQECLLPQLQISDLWKESGRWETYTKAEGIMFSLVDRQKKELALGPTHEEIITSIVRDMITSYKQMPLNLYQIQTKFRDEIRPRFGLMRSREFMMKDAYSFDENIENLQKNYSAVSQAYCKIFERCGLSFHVVEADSGAIGGLASQEFMVLTDVGEDEILYTKDGSYAANAEKATSIPNPEDISPFDSYEERETLNCNTLKKLSELLNCSLTNIVKNLLYKATYDNQKSILILVSIRGDQDVNEVKLSNELNYLAFKYEASTLLTLKISDQESLLKDRLPLGYIGPDLKDSYINSKENIESSFLRIADKTVINLKNFVTGSNKLDHHIVGGNWGQSHRLPELILDIRKAKEGDKVSNDNYEKLMSKKGIEVGHVFQLGTKYSEKMKATFTDKNGEEKPITMGCYGIGISRLVQSAVEQNYDKNGIIWPLAIAPYHAIIVVPNMNEKKQIEIAEKIYHDLNNIGIETILDDRTERIGVKFKDAELIGIPYQIVTGRTLKFGKVEVVERKTKNSQEVIIEELPRLFHELLKNIKLSSQFI